MPSPYRFRRATVRDIPALVRHRVEMHRSMKAVPDRVAALIASSFRRHLRRALTRGEYLGWVAARDGEVVAGAGVVLRPLLPRPSAPRGGREAYVLNVFTEPGHRRRGLACRLVREILSWARREGAVRVSLHASDQGRPVYEALGFRPTREMRIVLKKGRARG